MKRTLLFLILLYFLSFSVRSEIDREKAIEKRNEAVNVFQNVLSKRSSDSIQTALSIIDEAIAIDSTYVPAYLTKVTFLKKQDKYSESVKVMELAIQRKLKDPWLFMTRGMLNEKLNNPDLSISDYEKAISLLSETIGEESKNIDILSWQVFLKILLGKADTGIEKLENLLAEPLKEDEKDRLLVTINTLKNINKRELIDKF